MRRRVGMTGRAVRPSRKASKSSTSNDYMAADAADSAWTRRLPTALLEAHTAHERLTHLRIAPLSIPDAGGGATVQIARPQADEPTPPEPPSLASITPLPPSSTSAPAYALHPLHSREMSDFEQSRATEVDHIQTFLDQQRAASQAEQPEGSVGAGEDGDKGTKSGGSRVLLPHLLVPSSMFSGFVHQQPGGVLFLVRATVTESTSGRSFSSAELNQSEFDERMAALGGEGEGNAVSVRVEGEVSGLAAFRFDLYLYSDVRMSFSALVRPSSVPPQYYMQMIAANSGQVQVGPHDRSGPPRPCPWRGYVSQWVSTRHPRDRAAPLNFLQNHRREEQLIRQLTGEEVSAIEAEYAEKTRQADQWEVERRQRWVELGMRQAPHVKPRLCGVDEASLTVRALFHLGERVAVPVIATGADDPLTREQPMRREKAALHFRIDLDAALSSDPAQSKKQRTDLSLSPLASSSSSSSSSSSAPADAEANSRLYYPVHLPDVRSIFTYRQARLYRSVPLSRAYEKAPVPLEWLERLCGQLHPGVATRAGPTFAATHLRVDACVLRYSADVTEQFALELAGPLRSPLLGCELERAELSISVQRGERHQGTAHLVHPVSGYKLRFTADIQWAAEPSASPMVVASLDLGTPTYPHWVQEMDIDCSSGLGLCGLYDALYHRTRVGVGSGSGRQRQRAMPLHDSIHRCFPAVEIDDGHSSAEFNAKPSVVPHTPVSRRLPAAREKAGQSLRCTLDAALSSLSAVRLRSLHLVLPPPPPLPSPPDSGDQSSRCVAPSSIRFTLATKEIYDKPDTFHQRRLALTPRLEPPLAAAERPRPTAEKIPLTAWLRAIGRPQIAALLPIPVVQRAETSGGEALVVLDGDGRPEWLLSRAGCGPVESDALTVLHVYKSREEQEATEGDVVRPSSALRSFALLRHEQLLSPRLFPYLEDAVRGRALTPLWSFVQAETDGATLGKEEVKAVADFPVRAYAAEGSYFPGYRGWLEGIERISHEPAGAFIATQPHLSNGQLLLPMPRSPRGASTTVSTAAAPLPFAVLHSTPSTSASSVALLGHVMAIPGLFHAVLDALDLNSIVHALTVVVRSSRLLALHFSSAVMDRAYWSQSTPARFARWADAAPVHWQSGTLTIRRDRLLARLMEKDASRGDCGALSALPVGYLAAVEMQARLNTFSLRVMRQPAWLVLPQRYPPTLTYPAVFAHQPVTSLRPALVYSLPDAVVELLLVTPAFCGDQRPRDVYQDTIFWTKPPRDGRFTRPVRLSDAASPAEYVEREWLLPLFDARPDGDGDSVWAIYTGPTYVYEDGLTAQEKTAGGEQKEDVSGLRLTAEQATAVVAQHWRWSHRPSPIVSGAVCLRYVNDLNHCLVARYMPNIDGEKMHVYSSNTASCVMQARRHSPVIAALREQWRASAARLEDDERRKAAVGSAGGPMVAPPEEGTRVRDALQIEGASAMDEGMLQDMSGEVIAQEQADEDAGVRPRPPVRVCVAMQNLLLSLLPARMVERGDWLE